MTVPVHDPQRAGSIVELKQRAAALRAELPESAAEADARNTDSAHGMRRIWEEGFFSFHLPSECGGVTDASPFWIGDWYLAGKEPPFVAALRV